MRALIPTLLLIMLTLLLVPQHSSGCSYIDDPYSNDYLTYQILDKNGTEITTILTERELYPCGERVVADRVEGNKVVLTNDDNSKSLYDLSEMTGAPSSLSDLNKVSDLPNAYGGDWALMNRYLHTYGGISVELISMYSGGVNLTFYNISTGVPIRTVNIVESYFQNLGYNLSDYYYEKVYNSSTWSSVSSISPYLSSVDSYGDTLFFVIEFSNSTVIYDSSGNQTSSLYESYRIPLLVTMYGNVSYFESFELDLNPFSDFTLNYLSFEFSIADDGLYFYNQTATRTDTSSQFVYSETQIWRLNLDGSGATYLFNVSYTPSSINAAGGRISLSAYDDQGGVMYLYDLNGTELIQRQFPSIVKTLVLSDYVVAYYFTTVEVSPPSSLSTSSLTGSNSTSDDTSSAPTTNNSVPLVISSLSFVLLVRRRRPS